MQLVNTESIPKVLRNNQLTDFGFLSSSRISLYVCEETALIQLIQRDIHALPCSIIRLTVIIALAERVRLNDITT